MTGLGWSALRILSAAALSVAVAAAQPARADSLDQVATREMAARKIPGLSIAVIDEGRIVKQASYGLASVELGVPVTNATLFTLASTTKEFTAVAIMALVEDGRLSLDESVRTYLPELPAAWAPVTIRHCLSHTSGLPDGVAADQVNIIPLAGDREGLLKMLAEKPIGEPGVKASYNQTGIMLLGDIITRVSGKPYKSFIEERLLKPAGITDMKWGDSWDIVPGRASLYTALEPSPDRAKLALDDKGRPVFSKSRIYAFGAKGAPDWMTPAIGLNTSIESLARWEAALWSGKVIKPASLAMMGKAYGLRDGKPGAFGLGLIPGRQGDRPTVSSGGGAAVWVTTLPDSHLTAIVLTNLQASSPQSLVAEILDAYLLAKSAAR